MAYLTLEDYVEFTGDDELSAEEFGRLLPRASDFIDIQTRYFYQSNELELDTIMRRKIGFKKAIAYQIEFMSVTGALTSYDINTPQSWSVGRTSVSEASRFNATGQNESPSIVSEDAIAMLSGTGLLYRGLRS